MKARKSVLKKKNETKERKSFYFIIQMVLNVWEDDAPSIAPAVDAGPCMHYTDSAVVAPPNPLIKIIVAPTHYSCFITLNN